MKAPGHSIPNDLMSQLKAFHARNHLVCIASCRWKCASSRFLCPPGPLQALESFLCWAASALCQSSSQEWGCLLRLGITSDGDALFHLQAILSQQLFLWALHWLQLQCKSPSAQAPATLSSRQVPAMKICSLNKPKAEHGDQQNLPALWSLLTEWSSFAL